MVPLNSLPNCVLNRETPPQSVLCAIDPDEHFFNDVYRGLTVENESKYYSVDSYSSQFDNTSVHLDFMTFNIRSYCRNIDSFTAVLDSLYKRPEIIVLTET